MLSNLLNPWVLKGANLISFGHSAVCVCSIRTSVKPFLLQIVHIRQWFRSKCQRYLETDSDIHCFWYDKLGMLPYSYLTIIIISLCSWMVSDQTIPTLDRCSCNSAESNSKGSMPPWRIARNSLGINSTKLLSSSFRGLTDELYYFRGEYYGISDG